MIEIVRWRHWRMSACDSSLWRSDDARQCMHAYADNYCRRHCFRNLFLLVTELLLFQEFRGWKNAIAKTCLHWYTVPDDCHCICIFFGTFFAPIIVWMKLQKKFSDVIYGHKKTSHFFQFRQNVELNFMELSFLSSFVFNVWNRIHYRFCKAEENECCKVRMNN